MFLFNSTPSSSFPFFKLFTKRYIILLTFHVMILSMHPPFPSIFSGKGSDKVLYISRSKKWSVIFKLNAQIIYSFYYIVYIFSSDCAQTMTYYSKNKVMVIYFMLFLIILSSLTRFGSGAMYNKFITKPPNAMSPNNKNDIGRIQILRSGRRRRNIPPPSGPSNRHNKWLMKKTSYSLRHLNYSFFFLGRGLRVNPELCCLDWLG